MVHGRIQSNNNAQKPTILTILINPMKAKSFFQKKTLGLSQSFPFLGHKKLPAVKAFYFKGSPTHYALFQKHDHRLPRDAMVYCLERQAIELGLEMSYRRQKMLTIVSDTHYSTVGIIRKEKVQTQNDSSLMTEEQFKEYFSSEGGLTRNKQEQISKEVSSVALYLLRNYRFVIKSSFLDVHPLEAYQKMCGYLLTKRSRLITEPFQKPRFSGQILRESFVLVPILSEMRNRFLVTQKLKLAHLQRREGIQITDAMRESYHRQWEKLVSYDLIAKSSRTFDERSTLLWAIENNLGDQASVHQIVNKNKFRHNHFGTWD